MAYRPVSRFLPHPGMGEIAQGGVGVGPGDAVGRQAHVQLETAQRVFRMSAENGVVVAVEEPERTKRVLELQHIMTVEVGHTQIQRAVAQVERGIHQGRPYLLGYLLGDGQGRAGAEIGQGPGGGVVEDARHGIFRKIPDADEALLHVLDGGTGIVAFDRLHITSTCSRTSRP